MAKSLEKTRLNFCWLKVYQKAVDSLRATSYTNIEFHKARWIAKAETSIRDAHFIGLRSRTHLTEEIFAAAEAGRGWLLLYRYQSG